MHNAAKLIVVVDDEDGIRETYAAIFRMKGYEVLTAQDGVAALEVLSKAKPHVLVSDLKMPRMDGFELLFWVRQQFPEIGVIAISGHYTRTSPNEGLLTDAFFVKGSYDRDELLKKIAELIQQYPLRKVHLETDASSAPSSM